MLWKYLRINAVDLENSQHSSVYFKLINIKQNAILCHACAAPLKLNLISATLIFWRFLKRRLQKYLVHFLLFAGTLETPLVTFEWDQSFPKTKQIWSVLWSLTNNKIKHSGVKGFTSTEFIFRHSRLIPTGVWKRETKLNIAWCETKWVTGWR